MKTKEVIDDVTVTEITATEAEVKKLKEELDALKKANEPKPVRVRPRQRDLTGGSSVQTFLNNLDIPGFKCVVQSDASIEDAMKIQNLLADGFEFVSPTECGLTGQFDQQLIEGDKVVLKSRSGEKNYLLKYPIEWWNEDVKRQVDINQKAVGQATNPVESFHGLVSSSATMKKL